MMEQRFSTPLGVDFEKQIVPALDGRITYITWFEKPTTQVSGITLVGLKLKDIEPVKKAVENLAKRREQIISKQSYAGKEYYRVNVPVPPLPHRRQPVLIRRSCLSPVSALSTII